MEKLTFLTLEQVFGNEKIEIIRQYGAQSTITDFSILLDGFVLNNYHFKNSFGLENRTGMWFTKTFYNEDSFYGIDHRGCKNIISNIKRQCGVRPVLLFSSRINQDYIREVNYGEYPQSIVEDNESEYLEMYYKLNELEETGKIYTLDSAHNSDSNAKFMERSFKEYILEDKKYIRFVTEKSYSNGNLL